MALNEANIGFKVVGAKGFGDGDDYYDSYLVVVLKPLELDEEDTEKVQDAQF